MYCVFTAVVGPSLDKLRDELQEIKWSDPRVLCICFTNLGGYIPPKGWTARLVNDAHLEELSVETNQKYRLLARSIKLRPHLYLPSDLDIRHSLWIDGNVEFLTPPIVLFQDLLAKVPKGPFLAAFAHHERTTMSQELTAILHMRPEEITSLETLEALGRKAGFKDDMGLMESCVVLRPFTKDMEHFNALWWDLLVQTGLRDQIVLPLALHMERKRVIPLSLTYRWRAKEEGDLHVKGWPKAPWVHRLDHIKH